MGSWSICKRNSDCYTVRDGTRPNNRGFSRSRGGRPDLHGKIIRGGNFSSRARSSPMEKGEAIVPRDRVCYRSNVRTAIVSSLSLSFFFLFLFLFLFIFFFSVQLSLALFASFDSPSRLRPHRESSSVPPSRFALFSASFFHISAAPFRGDRISRTVDFISFVCFVFPF